MEAASSRFLARRGAPHRIPGPPGPESGAESMPEAVIVDAVRTPIGRAFKGSLAQ